MELIITRCIHCGLDDSKEFSSLYFKMFYSNSSSLFIGQLTSNKRKLTLNVAIKILFFFIHFLKFQDHLLTLSSFRWSLMDIDRPTLLFLHIYKKIYRF